MGKTVGESYPELVGRPIFTALDEVYRTVVAFVGNEAKVLSTEVAMVRPTTLTQTVYTNRSVVLRDSWKEF